MKAILLIIFFLANLTLKGDYWTQKANFYGFNRVEPFSFSIGSKGYIGCGITSSFTTTDDFWEYDPILNAWSQKADFPGGDRFNAIGFSLNNKGYAGLGHGSNGVEHDFWEYNPSSGFWTQKADFGGGDREEAIGFSIGNKGYAGTGYYANGMTIYYYNDFWEYDPLINLWIQKNNFPGDLRSQSINFSLGNYGYYGCGKAASGIFLSDFWQYDASTDLWTQEASFPGQVRGDAAAFSIGNFGYLGTGHGPPVSFYTDFWQYDPTANLWAQKANFPGIMRHESAYFSINNKGYIGMGDYSNGNTIFHHDFYEYTPDSLVHVPDINENKLAVKIFPNPFKNQLQVTYQNSEPIEFILYDLSLNKILQRTFSLATSINTESFANGIYYYEFRKKANFYKKGIIVKE